MNERGDWLQTASGRKLHILRPDPEQIAIEDITHALARICRFGGHVKCAHYSVAQHSVLVSRTCYPENALIGLLHDATEAYLGDMVRPLKYSLPGYREIEASWDIAIDEALDLGGKLIEQPPDVKIADNQLLSTERRDVMSDGPQHALWDLREPPLEEKIRPWNVGHAEMALSRRYRALTEGS